MAVTVGSLLNISNFGFPKKIQNDFSKITNPEDDNFYYPNYYNRSILIRYLAEKGLDSNQIFEEIRSTENNIQYQHGSWPCERPVYPSDIEKTLRPVEKLRSGSSEFGTIEPLIWKAFNPQEKWALKKAVRNFVLEEGASPNAYFVYEELIDLIDYDTGRLDPSIAYLAEKLHKGERTIQRCLNWLKENNLIGWKNRFIRKKNDAGVSYREQTSNAYYLGIFRNLPESVKAAYNQAIGRFDIPADEQHRIEQVKVEYEAMIESLPAEEWVDVALPEVKGNSELRESLASLGLAIEKKEAARKDQLENQSFGDEAPPRQNGRLTISNYSYYKKKLSNYNDPPLIDQRFAPEWQVHKLLAKGFSAQQIGKMQEYQINRRKKRLPLLDLLHTADLMMKTRQL